MPITVACPSCGQQGRVPETYQGQFVRCPKCRTKFPVSPPEQEPLEALPVVVDEHDSPAGPAAPAGWVLNPESGFPLTVHGVGQATAMELKHSFEDTLHANPHAWDRAVPIVAQSNLRCKEIDDYARSFRPQYLQTITRLKVASAEWASASEGDRKDLLAGFQEKAIGSLDVRPSCDLKLLFEFDWVQPHSGHTSFER